MSTERAEPIGAISNALADTAGGEMLAPTVKQIPVDRIQPDPDQPRRHVTTDGPEWEGLVNSVRVHGVLQPILVRRHPESAGSYMIIFGERRWRAAREVGLTHITAKVVKHPNLVARTTEYQVIENALRQDLTPLDELEAYKRYLDVTGKKKIELASELGVVKSVISEVFKLDRIHDPVRRQIREHGPSLSRRQLLRVASADTEEAQREIVSSLLANGEGKPTDHEREDRSEVCGPGFRCLLKRTTPAPASAAREVSQPTRIVITSGADRNVVAEQLKRLAHQLLEEISIRPLRSLEA